MMIAVISPEKKHLNEIEFINWFLSQKGNYRYHIRKPDWQFDHILNYYSDIHSKHFESISLHTADPHIKHPFGGTHCKSICNEKITTVNKIMSRSIHSLEEIVQHQKGYDYLLLSPFYDSLSKSSYAANKKLLESSENQMTNIVALGGITPDNIPELKSKGVAGVAVLGWIWNNANSIEENKQRLTKLQNVAKEKTIRS